jgi:hypothetical protein
MKIGSVELPIVSNIDEQEQADVSEIKSEIDSVAVKHDSEVRDLIISGFLNEEAHSNSLTVDQQKDEIKSLRLKEKKDNDISFRSFKGYLLVQSVNVDENTDSKIIKEIELECRYFPWPKYYPGDEP